MLMKFFKFLFSGTLMGILLIIFAISIGYATFIENDFNATTARLIVYNAHWFELVIMLMVVNFTGMIFTKKLYRKSKLNILFMHAAFIIIILGAAITRYIGFEGVMHIREGQTTNAFTSSDDFIHYKIETGSASEVVLDKVLLAPVNKKLYAKKIRLNDKNIHVSIEQFIPNATRELQKDSLGKPILTLVAASSRGRITKYIEKSETATIGNVTFSFGDTSEAQNVQIIRKDNQFYIRSHTPVYHIDMSSGEINVLDSNRFQQVQLMNLYSVNNLNFVLRDYLEKGSFTYTVSKEEGSNENNMVEVRVQVDNQSKTITLTEEKGAPGPVEQFEVDGVHFDMNVGAQRWILPFSLKLNDFQLDRYPGSQSPSSFVSEVTLVDKDEHVRKPYRIFMNNILAYKGYRFYQSSYDSDEKGTVLSVNHDYWGTRITYTGYFCLFLSLIASLFTRKTRFAKLSQQLREVHEERKKLLSALSLTLIMMLSVIGGAIAAKNPAGEILKREAENFGKLLVQTKDGRIVPLNTSASNILVKIYKKSGYEGLTGNQVLLSMLLEPQKWQAVPLIKVYDKSIRDMLGIRGDYGSFNDFFDDQGKYILQHQVNQAYIKKPVERSKFDKDLISVDERINVAYMAFNGSFLNIYPVPGHPENKWITPFDNTQKLKGADSLFIKQSFTDYLQLVKKGISTGDYTQANKKLQEIKAFQIKYGQEIIPGTVRINVEVIYNKVNIFKRLFPVYLTLGMVLLGVFLINLFKPSLEFKKLVTVILVILTLAFIAHTLGLAARWYISSHAPWSNGYESMIYIAWAAMLAGLVFQKKSAMTLSVTSILAGITLLTAHMSWMNPEITNLVPVLKSYWLTLHVATITASYGFLGLGSMLGFLNLCIMIFRNRKNQDRINLTLQEMTLIIDMTLMVGLILLVIGNFLGGVWANESWGRYWGWDPKETWSLVTIIVYTFILHMRLVPGLRSMFSSNFMALIGFGSVLMTYFGVNYYLSGLHSYAQGNPAPVPSIVYYTLAVVMLVSIGAAINDAKFKSPPLTA